MREPYPAKEVFIIRLWKQSVQDCFYHGVLQHIRTGKSVVIDDLPGLMAFFSPYLSQDNRADLSEISANKGLK